MNRTGSGFRSVGSVVEARQSDFDAFKVAPYFTEYRRESLESFQRDSASLCFSCLFAIAGPFRGGAEQSTAVPKPGAASKRP
jgi:hypothetical protein